jgi:O-antigen/teichoic acid export membrane protein
MVSDWIVKPRFQGYSLTLFNLATSIGNMLISFAIGFFLSPFIVKHLGAEANGFSQLAGNFVMYASLVTLAFNSMAGRFISVSYHQGRIEQANQYYSSVFIVNILMVLLSLPIACYVVYRLDHILVIENASVTDVKILFACVFFNFFLGLATSVYGLGIYVKNRLYISNAVSLFKTLSNAVLLLIVFSVFPIRLFYVSLITSALSLFLMPFNIYVQHQLLPELKLRWSRFSGRAVREMFLSGIWNSINQCGHLFNTGCDLLLANLFISPATMGVLAISKTVPSIIMSLTTTINSNFSPSVTIKWAEGDKDSFMRDLVVSMKISCILTSIPIVTFCCLGVSFYRLWMPTQDAGVIHLASVLAVFPFIPFAATQTLYNVFTATNKLQMNSVTFLIGAFLNFVIVYFYLKYRCLNGLYVIAGTSSLISIIRNAFVMLPYQARILQLKWYAFYKYILMALLCAGINVLIAALITLVISVTSWILLIFCGMLTVALSFMADAFVVLNASERAILFNLFAKKKHGSS